MNLNLMTPICATGYGVAGANILHSLCKQGVNVSLYPIGGRVDPEQHHVDSVRRSAKNSELFDPQAPTVRIYHQFGMAESIGRGERIGFTFFELDTFSKQEIHHLQTLDKIVVTCEWARQIVLKHLPTAHVTIVPLGVDMDIFNPNLVNANKPDDYIFLNAGKWERRKGHDFICDMFNSAFSPKDNVQLWLMPNNPIIEYQEQVTWTNQYLNSPMGRAGRIKILPWYQSQTQVAQVMAMSDCGFFPSRAEGWNLELLEMMAMGKQVIATNYSAHTGFCDTNNTHLIEIEETEPAHDNKWFFGQGSWAAIGHAQVEQAVEHMRTVYEDRVPNCQGIETGEKLSWDNSATSLVVAVQGQQYLSLPGEDPEVIGKWLAKLDEQQKLTQEESEELKKLEIVWSDPSRIPSTD